MKIQANNADEYIEKLPDERKQPMKDLRKAILENLPTGFTETIGYGMIGYVVPHSIYPQGYHCDPKLPLPFMNIASQKNYVAVYHMGLYANDQLMEWFVNEYPKHCKSRPDMGKSCLRFKKMNEIPYKLIGELSGKVSCTVWIDLYHNHFRKQGNARIQNDCIFN